MPNAPKKIPPRPRHLLALPSPTQSSKFPLRPPILPLYTKNTPRSLHMPGMTLTEKIMAKHSGKSRVVPGENIWVDVDVLMTHDVCGPGTIGIFHKEFGRNAKVWDKNKVVIIPDHY